MKPDRNLARCINTVFIAALSAFVFPVVAQEMYSGKNPWAGLDSFVLRRAPTGNSPTIVLQQSRGTQLTARKGEAVAAFDRRTPVTLGAFYVKPNVPARMKCGKIMRRNYEINPENPYHVKGLISAKGMSYWVMESGNRNFDDYFAVNSTSGEIADHTLVLHDSGELGGAFGTCKLDNNDVRFSPIDPSKGETKATKHALVFDGTFGIEAKFVAQSVGTGSIFGTAISSLSEAGTVFSWEELKIQIVKASPEQIEYMILE